MQLITFKQLENGRVHLELDLSMSNSASFLEKEESLALLLNEAGRLATAALLQESSEASKRIESEGMVYYQKGIQKKT